MYNLVLSSVSWAFCLSMAFFSSGCATDDVAAKEASTAKEAASIEKDVELGIEEPNDDDDDEMVLEMPKSFAEMSTRLEFLCPAPLFSFAEPHQVKATDEQSFTVSGSSMTASPSVGERLVLGVLGAIKDPTDATRRNLERAEKAFAKAGVHAVVVNGDLAEDEDIAAVFLMLGEVFKRPVFAHSGNIEWSASFNHAWEAAAKLHPHVFNMNWIRVVDFGKHTLLTMPGYFNHRFMRSGACHYETDDVEALLPAAKKAHERGHVVLLSSHGPPLGKKKGALDVIDEGNHVGDPALNKLIEEGSIKVGIFSHILEAGGRATVDLAGAMPHLLQKKKMSKPTDTLFINAGSASAGGWEMNDGKQSLGMAAIVVVTQEGAQVSFIRLR
ncbi:MAG: hypothetical protein GY822_02860 [Deltaproteobacteria bacterium]|nr:hypothetical protein [Deltaproteobacteria bacterium]